jgi:hypothetical protein
MKAGQLQAVEALLRNCAELAVDAREQAHEGGDAVLERRLGALAKLIKDELSNTRARLAMQLRRAAG